MSKAVDGDVSPLDPDPVRRCAAFRQLRAEGTVVPFPGLENVLAAVAHEAVDVGLSRVEAFGGSAGQDGVPEVDQTIAALVEPRHGKVRRIINSVVAIHKSQRIEPYLQELSGRLVDGMLAEARTAGAAGVDLARHLAVPLPPSAMARLFGFPEEDAQLYYTWMSGDVGKRYQEAAAAGRSISIAETMPELGDYVDARIAERVAQPQDDWPNDALTRFLTTEIEGEQLQHRSIRAQILFMIGAGTETTRNTIANLFFHLGRNPDMYTAIRNDRSLVDAAIEETLRIDAPAQWMVRTCRHATELAGKPIEPGQKVFMCIGSANHDESVFEQPDDFVLERANRGDHLAFGSGAHICPGAPLARMEIRAAVGAVMDRVEAFHLVDPDNYDPLPTAMLQGPRALPVVIDAEVGG